MREKMRAGPGCEDLKMRCPYFYTVALGLQPFVYNDDALAAFVAKTFRARYQVSIRLAACVRFSNDVVRARRL
jgi:GINS complex subunit 3